MCTPSRAFPPSSLLLPPSQSIKYVNEAEGYIDDYFVFQCFKFDYISPQRENRTSGATGKQHVNGLFDMTVRYSDFKMIMDYEWNTEMIGFRDDGQDQYEWVIEYQCGTRPMLPDVLCAKNPEGCFMTGVQMFVRDLDNIERGRAEMIDYLRSLGPSTGSAPVAWVMDDFGQGTFPPWFVNVTEIQKKGGGDGCRRPCSSGVFNATTGMWGCPKEHRNGDKIATAPPHNPEYPFNMLL